METVEIKCQKIIEDHALSVKKLFETEEMTAQDKINCLLNIALSITNGTMRTISYSIYPDVNKYEMLHRFYEFLSYRLFETDLSEYNFIELNSSTQKSH